MNNYAGIVPGLIATAIGGGFSLIFLGDYWTVPILESIGQALFVVGLVAAVVAAFATAMLRMFRG